MRRSKKYSRRARSLVSSIVINAHISPLTDIGQFTKAQKKELNAAVKAGILKKGKGGPYPKIKTVYAAPGINLAKHRRQEIRAITMFAKRKYTRYNPRRKHAYRRTRRNGAWLNLLPAYGRDYKTAKQVKEAWSQGKDFIIADIMHPYSGKPMNKQDARKGETYMIRYDRQMKICVIKG
jgi:hypothetical protein